MDTLVTAAQDDSSGANPSSVKSDDSSPCRGSGSSSPPPNCAICLGTCKNKSFTDSCLHQFCFTCLLTWSKVKAECPLCKQAFRSIIHNVQSNHQYEEYLVVQQNEETSSRIEIDRVAAAPHRFRYRRETIAIQQLLRHYPFMADVFPPTNGRSLPTRLRRRSPAAFRRTVYRHNLWARPLPDFTGRYRDCSPEFYRYNDTQMHRLVPWLNRELHYLLNENVGHISYVLTRLLELLPEHHINSPEFRACAHRYFGDRTEHFLHELYCFASTPYDISGYDRNVQYTTDARISTMTNHVISSVESDESADSDIVEVNPPPGPSRIPAPVYPQSCISQPPATNNVIPIETISQSDSDSDSSDVMIVGYIKPPQDRTPEIVDLLGSDSDVIVQESQPELSASSVKVTLKRHRTRSISSSSDDSYRPIQPKRRRSDTAQGSSITSTTSSATSTTFTSLDSSGSTTPVYDLDAGSYSSTDEEAPARVRTSKSSARDRKRLRKRLSHPRQKENLTSFTTEAEKRNSRKSHSGKGVKSSRRNNQKSLEKPAQSTTAPLPAPTARSGTPELPALCRTLDQPQPSTSGAQSQKRESKKERKRRRRRSRENRRLRSVVNVINSHKNADESNSSGNYSNFSNTSAPQRNAVQEPAPRPASRAASSTDSEDNLPLNLTLQKITPSSAT